MSRHDLTNRALRSDSRIVAMLGPTNTGKTYRAIDRMLSFESGMIGFPLRLLARENYDRIAQIKGRSRVALVTGEEKIIPANAKYFCCTVESMPVERSFEFVAVDEVQLAEDPERGHIFTDRILRARGSEYTMFMGAATMRLALAKLVPNIEFEECKRFSNLDYKGFKKLTRLPKRSAIVAFSMDEVYNTAEMIRRHRGGTAVVLGALSPRTRNAQVALFQSGEVDFMVATDAIGMGLNMDIRHVALAATRKFDGQHMRPLRDIELAQIAGRAGRYTKDGTFGVTGRISDLDEESVKAIEGHKFESVRELYWRNAALDFSSPNMLYKSLDRGSGDKMLVRGRMSDDAQALKALIGRDDILGFAQTPDMVRTLWEVCQIPDFRQTLSDAHQELLANIFLRVAQYGILDEDWVAAQIIRLNDIQGDVDALMARLAHVRTWTYISYKSHWLGGRADYWQGQTRMIEDRLSDALHEALIKRFVDQRAAVLMQSLEAGKELLAGVRANGEVVVESHLIGHLHAFRFIPDREAIGAEYKAVMNAARKALQSEIKRRLTMILNAKPEQITLDATGQLLWQQKVGSPLPGEPVARLKKGGSPLKPDIELIDTDFLAGVEKEALQSFLTQWLQAHLGAVLEPLIGLEQTDDLPASVRGICFQVYEAMGIIPREKLEDLIAALSTEDRAALRTKKIKLGPILVFLPALNKPAAVRLRALLWALYQGRGLPVDVPKDGIVSVKVDLEAIDKDFYQSIGYPVYGGRAIRIDMLDRVISAVYDSAQGGKFQAQHKMAEWLGCPIDDLYAVLESMGHKKIYDPLSEKTEADAITEEKPEKKAEEKPEEPVVEPMVVVAPETTVAAVEVSETLVAQDQTPQEQAPQGQIKPELATFRLKKGKAFESAKPYTPRHEGQENRKPFQGKKSAPHNAPYKSGDKPHNKSQDSSGGRGQERGQGKDFKKPDKSKRRANPKGKDYKQSNMVAEAKVKDDSPFAILEQLKKNADGKG